ncbi:acidic leucine-rich nuclear phosphoprotein 32 family member A-like [Chenopodium quinoa]|uniref:acidic leucine-rich nuclear phosphoprotein 32 family member A-like n=1 Tax=Chenopodium quinoa TaxID=63459 RepID=UPI000B789343|nr:acidic leucine-rich nuclear phosphoprotein 32 family member A-like [Chenopodium quinoa]
MKELEYELSSYVKEKEDKFIELGKIQNEHSSIMFELDSTKSQLISSEDKVIQLEELKKVQDQLCLAVDEFQSAKFMLESSKQKVKELKDQYSVCKMELQKMEAKRHRLSDYLCSIDSEVKLTDPKSDGVEISMLPTEIDISLDYSEPMQQSEGEYGNSCGIRNDHEDVEESFEDEKGLRTDHEDDEENFEDKKGIRNDHEDVEEEEKKGKRNDHKDVEEEKKGIRNDHEDVEEEDEKGIRNDHEDVEENFEDKKGVETNGTEVLLGEIPLKLSYSVIMYTTMIQGQWIC